MTYLILFEFYGLGFICNIYCIMLFILGFKAPLRRFCRDVMDATLANCGVFTQWHVDDVEVRST